MEVEQYQCWKDEEDRLPACHIESVFCSFGGLEN